MRIINVLALAALGGAFLSAGPITFTFSATGSGTVNTTPFTNEPFTITLTSDTSLITSGGGIFQTPPFAGAPFSISGVGTGTLTDLADVFDNQNDNGVGFQDLTNSGILGEIAAFAGAYQLNASLSPQSGSDLSAKNFAFPTSFGSVSFTSISGDTFSAATGTPEPGSLMLAALGIVAIVAGKRRRSRG